jgi:hypothetical protein
LPVDRPVVQIPLGHWQPQLVVWHISTAMNAAFVEHPVAVDVVMHMSQVVSAMHAVNSEQQFEPRQSPHGGSFESARPVLQMSPESHAVSAAQLVMKQLSSAIASETPPGSVVVSHVISHVVLPAHAAMHLNSMSQGVPVSHASSSEQQLDVTHASHIALVLNTAEPQFAPPPEPPVPVATTLTVVCEDDTVVEVAPPTPVPVLLLPPHAAIATVSAETATAPHAHVFMMLYLQQDFVRSSRRVGRDHHRRRGAQSLAAPQGAARFA